MVQSGLFVAAFYAVQLIWERDRGLLTKLLVTPTARSALMSAKAFAAGADGLAAGADALARVTAARGRGVFWAILPVARRRRYSTRVRQPRSLLVNRLARKSPSSAPAGRGPPSRAAG